MLPDQMSGPIGVNEDVLRTTQTALAKSEAEQAKEHVSAVVLVTLQAMGHEGHLAVLDNKPDRARAHP